MNIREAIESAIAEKCHVYEIEYLNSSKIDRCWHICDIQYSEEFGDSHIVAYVNELQKCLTFRIDRILKCDKYWVDILNDNDIAPADGLYVFACRGDNHIYTEIFMMKQGERLCKYFSNEYAHCNGWLEVIPLAYHIVDTCEIEHNQKWDRSTENLEKQCDGRINVVVATRDDASNYANGISAFRTATDICNFYILGDFESDMANGGIKITPGFVGFYTVMRYLETNHLIN